LKGTRLCELTVSLPTAAPAGGRPGEVSDRDDEEAVASVGNTSEGVVPGSESCKETEETTSLLNGDIDIVVGVPLQVGDTEEQEGQVQEEEEQEESDGRLEGAEQHDGGEDEPALFVVSECSLQSSTLQRKFAIGARQLTIKKRPMEL
jgi:hypothetical protein